MATNKQQGQQPPRLPLEHDSYWGNINNPEWQRQQREKLAQQQAARKSELDLLQQMEADRLARVTAEKAGHEAFLQRAHQRREAVARGEIGPVDPQEAIPSLNDAFAASKLAAAQAQREKRKLDAERPLSAWEAALLPRDDPRAVEIRKRLINGEEESDE